MAICRVCGTGFEGANCPKCGNTPLANARCGAIGIFFLNLSRWVAIFCAILTGYYTVFKIYWTDEFLLGLICLLITFLEIGMYFAFTMAVKYARGV